MFLTEQLVSLLAPHKCIQCGDEGAVVCEWCLPDIAPPLPDRCYVCKSQTPDSRICKRCMRSSSLRHVWVCTDYEGLAKKVIHDFKFARKQAAAETLVSLMSESLPYLRPDTLIAHIPTAGRRARRRGYDHAELLAQALSDRLKLPFYPLLRRSGQTRQVGATRKERLIQLEGAFTATRTDKIESPILLVDDLVTTGGTLETAARCLKRAGAKQVNAVVFAQKE